MSTTQDPFYALLYNASTYFRWDMNTPVGKGVNITYSFPTQVPYVNDPNGVNQSTFSAFTAGEREAAKQVLNYISEVLNITFTEVTSGGQMTFANQGMNGTKYADSSAYAYYPDGNNLNKGGDIWMNSDYFNINSPNLGPNSYFYETLLHEIGHTLGLKHPHEGDYTLDGDLDNFYHTVMTYNVNGFSYYPDTYMVCIDRRDR